MNDFLKFFGVLLLVVFVLPSEALAQKPEATVGVSVTELSEKDFEAIDALTLLRRLVLRLAEEGFSVTQPESKPAIGITISKTGDVVNVRMDAGEFSKTSSVVSSNISIEALHLALEHAVVELAREGVPHIKKTPEETPKPDPKPDPIPKPRVWNLVSIGGGAQYWGESFTPAFVLDYRHGNGAFQLGARLTATFGNVRSIDLLEASGAVVADFGVFVTDRAVLSIGTSLGWNLHRYDFVATGTKFAPNAGVTLDQRFFFGAFILGLSVSPTIVFTKYEHVDGEDVLFDATFFRLPATLSIGLRF